MATFFFMFVLHRKRVLMILVIVHWSNYQFKFKLSDKVMY